MHALCCMASHHLPRFGGVQQCIHAVHAAPLPEVAVLAWSVDARGSGVTNMSARAAVSAAWTATMRACL